MPMGDFDMDGSMIAAAPAALDPTILSNLSDSLSSLSFSDLTGSAQGLIDAFATNIDSTITNLIQNAGLPPGIASAATSVLDTLAQAVTGGGGASANIDFPVYDNPKSILNLLFGQDVDLVAFNANFDLSLPPSISPPGASYLGVSVGVTTIARRGGIAQNRLRHLWAARIAEQLGNRHSFGKHDRQRHCRRLLHPRPQRFKSWFARHDFGKPLLICRS